MATPGTTAPSNSPGTAQPKNIGNLQNYRIKHILFIASLGLINACALLVMVMSLLIGLFAGSAGIVLIAFIPITVLTVIVACVTDIIWLGYYLLSRQHPAMKRAAATVGLTVALAILILAGFYLYSILNVQNSIAKGQVSGYQRLLSKAAGAGYGFSPEAPNWVPRGYVWAGGKVDTEIGISSTYFEVDYGQVLNDTDTGNSFSIIIYRKGPNFDPPSNCGYYLGPYNTNNLPQDGSVPSQYTCALVGKTSSGSKVYYYYGQSVVTGNSDNYYVQDGNSVVILDTGPGTLSHSQAIKILNSLQYITMDNIAKYNASDNDY